MRGLRIQGGEHVEEYTEYFMKSPSRKKTKSECPAEEGRKV